MNSCSDPMASSGPAVQYFLSSENYKEIFSDRFTWIIDDTNAFGVTVRTCPEGHYSAKAINGSIFILNPTTGRLFLKVIHPSEWEDGQKPLGQLAEWKTAKEVCTWIHSLPVEDRPKQIIPTRRGILGPMESFLTQDFPDIVVRGSALKLPLQEFLRIEPLRAQIFNASEPQMILSNLYDDWLERTSSMAAFSRLILILRALSVNNERAKLLMNPEEKIVTQPHHIWPSLGIDQWKKAEAGLKDLIVSDYVNKINVSIQK